MLHYFAMIYSQPASNQCWVPPRDGHDLGFLGGPGGVKHQAYLERSLDILVAEKTAKSYKALQKLYVNMYVYIYIKKS